MEEKNVLLIFSETVPFREPVNLVDHFKLRHQTAIDENVVGDKADKVTVVQVS